MNQSLIVGVRRMISKRRALIFIVALLSLTAILFFILQRKNQADVVNNGEILISGTLTQLSTTLTSPNRSLGSKYPTPPKITLSTNEFKAELNGTTYRYVRPLISNFDQAPAGGRSIYVSPGAAGNGDQNNPFGSINAAIEAASAGDTIVINQGEYAERVVIRKSGTSSKPIKITAAAGALPRIVRPFRTSDIPPASETSDMDAGVFEINGSQHIWVNGLILEGTRGRSDNVADEDYGASGITILAHGGLGVKVTNSIIYWAMHCGIKEMNHQGTGFLLESNILMWNGSDDHDHGIYLPSSDTTVRGNLIFGSAGYGIHAYESPERNLIERNVLINNEESGIIVAGSSNRIFNNTAIENDQHLGDMFVFRGGATNNVVKNNIFGSIGYDDSYGVPANNDFDYNIIYPNSPAQPPLDPNQFRGSYSKYTDPLFRGKSSGDLRLASNSPAIDAGIALNGIQYFGSAPDIGAFESLATYNITPQVTGSGTLSIASQVSVNQGENLTIEAHSADNWHIKEIKVDDVSVGNVSSYTFSNIVANHTIRAIFEENPASPPQTPNTGTNSNPSSGTTVNSSTNTSSNSAGTNTSSTVNTTNTSTGNQVSATSTNDSTPTALVDNAATSTTSPNQSEDNSQSTTVLRSILKTIKPTEQITVKKTDGTTLAVTTEGREIKDDGTVGEPVPLSELTPESQNKIKESQERKTTFSSSIGQLFSRIKGADNASKATLSVMLVAFVSMLIIMGRMTVTHFRNRPLRPSEPSMPNPGQPFDAIHRNF